MRKYPQTGGLFPFAKKPKLDSGGTTTMMTWTENDIRRYDIAAIEDALIHLGASEEEASSLTDILHTEGWGGIEEQGEDEEGDIRDAALVSMIDWYRTSRKGE